MQIQKKLFELSTYLKLHWSEASLKWSLKTDSQTVRNAANEQKWPLKIIPIILIIIQKLKIMNNKGESFRKRINLF